MQLRTRVKICGITRSEDVLAATAAGADAIGFVFYPKSSRLVSVEQAQQLRRMVPPFVSVVVLFVNATAEQVNNVLEMVQPDLLQFHGDETPEFCAHFGHRYLRAFRIGGLGLDTPQAILAECKRYPDATGWLFDSYSPGYGGSGLTFDSALLDDVRNYASSPPVIVAGGVKAETVGETIRTLQPYGLDISSGVEISGGIKSAEKIQVFMQAVREA